ncbi:MAG: glycosyltransferase family 4 protein [Bacteroidales bacterium]|jgi:Fuc2NAc and GlcNAc transferase|nr:glycosyltransferase family 4 protein [Bacteroidales bacterium]MCU0409104.1 glycosyltransferase family 4 protein [Bacteroidales bacterium]
MNHLLLLTGIMILSFAGTYVVMIVARRKNILDIPNARSSHSLPTPRGGGLAIVISWYAGITLLWLAGGIETRLFLAFIAGFALALVSLLDDLHSVSPSVRFSVQVLTSAAGILLIGGVRTIYAGGLEFSFPILLTFLAVIAAVWFINLFNFLDGIDGYASVQAIVTSSGIYLVTGNPFTGILVFSVLGFLAWNWPRAKIFMGDVGSTQLGYILVISGIYFSNMHELSIAGWLMLTMLFWVDATLTLYRRFRNREKLSVAHKKHFYQRIVRYGFTHGRVLSWQIAVSILFMILVLLSERKQEIYYLTFPACLIMTLAVGRLIDSRFPFNKSE